MVLQLGQILKKFLFDSHVFNNQFARTDKRKDKQKLYLVIALF